METNIHLNLLFNDRHVFVFPSWKEKKKLYVSMDEKYAFVDGNSLYLEE
jgi:hypothetical protein